MDQMFCAIGGAIGKSPQSRLLYQHITACSMLIPGVNSCLRFLDIHKKRLLTSSCEEFFRFHYKLAQEKLKLFMIFLCLDLFLKSVIVTKIFNL